MLDIFSILLADLGDKHGKAANESRLARGRLLFCGGGGGIRRDF